MFAGLDEGELSTSLRALASGSSAADRMVLLPAVQRNEMCGIFRSAVITVWRTLSIWSAVAAWLPGWSVPLTGPSCHP